MINNGINTGNYPTEKQHQKNIRLANFKFMGVSQIIFLNYRKCLDEKGFEHYYNLYLARHNSQIEQGKLVSFETFSKDKYVDKVISMYCEYFSDSNLEYEGMKILEKIEFIYKDLIDDASDMGNDKIVNK